MLRDLFFGCNGHSQLLIVGHQSVNGASGLAQASQWTRPQLPPMTPALSVFCWFIILPRHY